MRKLLIINAICVVVAGPAVAEDSDGKSLMERGAELFMEGLRQEMEPTLDEFLGLADQFGPAMQSFLQEMGPALAELAAQVEDWSAYEAPEILPNGDIILRKKQKDEVPEQTEPEAPAPSEGVTDI